MRKRQFKKVLSLVLALAMVFSMNTSVFATADVTVPAAETQTEAQPETPVTNETETPAPAETPAEAEPAAEAAPADEAAPAPEATPEEEAPAKAEEPAKEAAPVAEAEKEEAAGVVTISGLSFTPSAEGDSAEQTGDEEVTITGTVTVANQADANVTIFLAEGATLNVNNGVKDGDGGDKNITINNQKGTVNVTSNAEVAIHSLVLGDNGKLVVEKPTSTTNYTLVKYTSDTPDSIAVNNGEDVEISGSKTGSLVVVPKTADIGEETGDEYTFEYSTEKFSTKTGYKYVGAKGALAEASDVSIGEADSESVVKFGKRICLYKTADESLTQVTPARQDAPVALTRKDTDPCWVNAGKVNIEFTSNPKVQAIEFALSANGVKTWQDGVANGNVLTLNCTESGDYKLVYRLKADAESKKFAGLEAVAIDVTTKAPVESPWKAYTGNLKVTGGKLMVSENDAGVVLISSDKADNTKHILYNESKDAVALKKVYVSGNNGTYLSNVAVEVSGNAIAVASAALGKWVDGGDGYGDAGKALSIKATSKVYFQNGAYTVPSNAAYVAGAYVYEGEALTTAEKEYTVSYNENWISFNKAGKIVSVNTTLVNVDFAANQHITDKEVAFVNQEADKIFVQFENGNIGYINEAIHDYGDETYAGTITEVSEDGVVLPGTTDGYWYALSGGSLAAPSPLSDEGWTKATGTSLTFNNLEPKTAYKVLVRQGNGTSTFRRVKDTNVTFSTKAEARKGVFTESKDWYATATLGGDAKAVSENSDGALVIPSSLAGEATVYLVASTNKADKINTIYISGDSVNVTKVVLSANASGVEIADPAVINDKTGAVIADALVSKEGSVNKNGEVIGYYPAEDKLLKGDMVYLPVVLEKGKDFTVSYDSVTIALSGDRAGKAVLAGTKTVSIDMVNNKKGADKDSTPADDFIGAVPVVIESKEAGISYYVITENIGEYVDVPAVANIEDYRSDYFKLVTADGIKYAFSTVSYANIADRKDLSFKEYKTDAEKKIVSYNNAAKNEDVKKLTGGQTYYIYAMAEANVADKKFANYSQSNQVTLGVSIDFIAKPVVETHMIDSTVSFGDIKLAADPVTYDKGSEKATVSDADLAKAYKLDEFQYGVSLNGWNDNKESLVKSGTDSAKLTKGKTDYTVKAAENFKPEEAKVVDFNVHNDTTLKINNNTFYVMSTNSTLEVTPGTFYYAQNEDALIKNALAVADGKGKVPESSLDVQIGTVSGDKFTPDAKIDIKTLSAGSTFGAHFFIKGATDVSANKTVTVEKRPVVLTAKQNYFSLRHKDLVSANKIDPAYLVVEDKGDIYETPQAELLKKYFSGDVKPKFGSDINKDAISDNAYNYELSYTTAKDVTSGNYVVSSRNAEGFGYYVLPVYTVTYKDEVSTYTLVSTSSNKITPSGELSSNAVLAYQAGKFKDNEEVKGYDYKAEVVLPKEENIQFKVSANKFLGWKGISANVYTDTITTDTTYVMEYRKTEHGFKNEKIALSFMFDENNKEVYYTGLKHITDPRAIEAAYADVEGYQDAINKLEKAAVPTAATANVDLQIFVGSRLLVEGIDYTAKYKNNINAFELEKQDESTWAKKAPQVTITFKNEYASYPTTTKYFSIYPADIGNGEPDRTIVTGYGLDSKIVKVNTKLKTDLKDAHTGKALVVGTSSKPKDLLLSVEKAPSTASTEVQKVTITGTGNYTGTIDAEYYVIDGKTTKIKWTSLNIKDSKAAVNPEFNPNEDSLYANWDAIVEDINKNIATKANIEGFEADDMPLYRVKADYRLPGKQKVTYKAYKVTENEGKLEIIAYKGTYNYIVKNADTNKVEIPVLKSNEAVKVPYKVKGATVPYVINYDGTDITYGFYNMFKVQYAGNKKPTTTKKATLKISPVKKYFGSGDAFGTLSFDVEQADLSTPDAFIIRNAYNVTGKNTDKDIKKLGSVVVTDSLGNVLKYGTDYTAAFDGTNVTIKASSKSKNYKGELTGTAEVVDHYLGAITPKFGSGANKKIPKSLMGEIEADNEEALKKLNNDYVKTLVKDGTAVATFGTDYEIVVTTNKSGGKAYIQVVGIDGSKWGGSDVLGKKQLTVSVVAGN